MGFNAMHQDVNSNTRGCLLKKIEVETDSDVPEFSLPPKSIVKRPKKVIRRRTHSSWRKYCKKCCGYCSGVLLALVLCACVLSIGLLFWFSLRLYRDVENLSRKLTIEINRVETEQVANVEKCASLKLQMKANMKVLENGQKDILNFKKQLQVSYAKIAMLNRTLLKVSYLLHSPGSKMSLGNAVNALKKGMADTGAEMTKLSDEIKQIGEATSFQSTAIKRIIVGLFNISSSLANVTRNSQVTFHFNPEDYLQQMFHDENLPSDSEHNTNGSVLLRHLLVGVKQQLMSTAAWQFLTPTVSTFLLEKTEVPEKKTQISKEELIYFLLGKHIHKAEKQERPTDIYDAIHRLNSSLSAKMELLQSETQVLMNAQVRNISQSSSDNNQIQLLWETIEWQNQSIIHIQEIMKQSMQKSGIPTRRGTEKRKDSSTDNDFELFPEDADTPRSEHRPDTSRRRMRKFKSDSDKNYLHKFVDFGDDSNT